MYAHHCLYDIYRPKLQLMMSHAQHYTDLLWEDDKRGPVIVFLSVWGHVANVP